MFQKNVPRNSQFFTIFQYTGGEDTVASVRYRRIASILAEAIYTIWMGGYLSPRVHVDLLNLYPYEYTSLDYWGNCTHSPLMESIDKIVPRHVRLERARTYRRDRVFGMTEAENNARKEHGRVWKRERRAAMTEAENNARLEYGRVRNRERRAAMTEAKNRAVKTENNKKRKECDTKNEAKMLIST